jgi:hypothetical protein
MLASVIIDRTHTVCGSEMEAASATTSPLGFGLHLMEHKVLMHMRGGARRGVVVLTHERRELEIGWESTRERSGHKTAGKLRRRK